VERQTVARVHKPISHVEHIRKKGVESSAPAHPLVDLQRSVGNQAIQRLICSPFIQRKLQISTPEDPLEREADHVANTVMRMPEPKTDEDEKREASPPTLQRQPLAVREEDDEEKIAPKLEADSNSDEKHENAPEPAPVVNDIPVQLKVRDEDKEEDPLLPPAPAPQTNHLQRSPEQFAKYGPARLHDSDSALPGYINRMRGGGDSLPLELRGFFGSRFGVDFSNVRLHTGAAANEAAQSIQARAFTVGQDIVFGPGEYQPHTAGGKQLLAHELTHTVQQSGGASPVSNGAPLVSRQPISSSPAQIQRDGKPGTPSAEDQQRIDKALQTHAVGDVIAIEHIDLASDVEKIQLSRIMVEKREQTGGGFAEKMVVLWGSFGERLKAVATANLTDFDAAIKAYPVLAQVSSIKSLIEGSQNTFLADVTNIAVQNLFDNRNYVLERKKALGLDPGASPPLSPEAQSAVRRNIQDLAYRVWELRQQQAAMKNKPVSYLPMAFAPPSPVMFNPGAKPTHVNTFGLELPKWDDLKVAWDVASGEIVAIISRYPEIYAAVASEKPDDELLQLSRVIPSSFNANVTQLLDGLIKRIENVAVKISNGEIKPIEMDLVHAKLLQGIPGPSGRRWNEGVDQWAVKRLLSEHKQREEAIRNLETAVEVAALVVATFATAGSLTFFIALGLAVGVPAVQGAIDWNDAQKKNEMAKATPLQGTELLLQSTADALKAKAVAEFVRALVNAITIGGPVALKALQSELLITRLGQLGTMSTAEAAALIEQAVAKLGAAETVRVSGRSAQELLAIVGENSSATAALRVLAGQAAAASARVVTAAQIGIVFGKGAAGTVQRVDEMINILRQLTAQEATNLRNLYDLASTSGMAAVPNAAALRPSVRLFLSTPTNHPFYRARFGTALQHLTEDALAASGAQGQYGLIFRRAAAGGIPDVQMRLTSGNRAIFDWTTPNQVGKISKYNASDVDFLVEVVQPGP
jgi:Domain of unknown function (DUF4157)